MRRPQSSTSPTPPHSWVWAATAYKLVHDGQWPTPFLRLGRLIKIPTQPLLDLLAGTTRGSVDESAGTNYPQASTIAI
jgi:hypothetical protein